MHGARGVILINDRANHSGEQDTLENFANTVGPADAGIPFVQIKAEVADRWFAAAGKKLEEIQAAIDKDLKPQSFALPGRLRVEARLDLERATEEGQQRGRVPAGAARTSTSSSGRTTTTWGWASSFRWRLRRWERCIRARTTTPPGPPG